MKLYMAYKRKGTLILPPKDNLAFNCEWYQKTHLV